MLRDPEYAPYLENMIEQAMTHNLAIEPPDVDVESYEEVRSVALDMEEEMLAGN